MSVPSCACIGRLLLTDVTFSGLGLRGPLAAALEDRGFTTPTPIQALAIPHLLEGRDVMGLAQTGTGKTAAFGLPLLQRLLEQGGKPASKRPRSLILAPTRELAAQIHDELGKLAEHTPLRFFCIYGGVGQNPQVRAVAKGVDVLIATPGRLLDLMNQGHINLSDVSALVLDEADRLLDMGFVRDVRKIVAKTPNKRQSLLFSATMAREVEALAAEILHEPEKVDVSPKEISVRKIKQSVVIVDNPSKRQVLEKMLHMDEVSRAIVFTRTKHGANKLAKQLVANGIATEVIHGNKSQNARNQALAAFKSGKAWVMIATDIAARGIDIDGISHVINYELPHEPESYVHRVGRTGRAGASGIAWSLVDRTEIKRLKAVERLIGFTLPKLDIEIPPRPKRDPADQETPRRSDGQRRGNGGGARSGGGRGGNSGNRRRSGGGQKAASGNNSGGNSSGGNQGNRPAGGDAKPKRRRRRPNAAAA